MAPLSSRCEEGLSVYGSGFGSGYGISQAQTHLAEWLRGARSIPRGLSILTKQGKPTMENTTDKLGKEGRSIEFNLIV